LIGIQIDDKYRNYLAVYIERLFRARVYKHILKSWSEFIKYPSLCITIACFVYLVYPPNNIIVHTVLRTVKLDTVYRSEIIHNPLIRVLRYYVPDFLWALALAYVLVRLWKPSSIKSNLLLVSLFLAFTVSLEFAQIGSFVPGHFDCNDIYLYLSMGLIYLVIKIFIIHLKNNKKRSKS